MTTQFTKTSRWVLIALVAATFTVSCSKNEDLKPEEEVPEESSSVPFYKLQRVDNFAVETDDKNPTETKSAAYFSLETKQETPANYAKTARWDLGFNGLYNSFISGNNGKEGNNLGYGGAGTGGILIVEKPFNEVTDVPADADFKTKVGVVGTDSNGDFGQGTGWYLYDFGGSIVGDGSYDKMHVAYALSEATTLKNGTQLKARTLIIRTAKGNYAKVKMISCYKDAFTPDKWFRTTPHMFFTFEYVIVPKGSTKFEIK
ncbi:MAG: HmuY family protein [Bacteroidota bacterium]